ncbi:hypothetical protein, partial [Enterococcus lactis]|uniref:hypothetical protein n=1 Tax=Enterococcus lactis TaxID=357441 RepID=UPI001C7DEE49
CFSNFCNISAYFSKKLLLEHRISEIVKKLFCIILHQVIRTAKQKQLIMFLNWLDLLPQMQAFEHRLFGKRDCDKIFVTVPLH